MKNFIKILLLRIIPNFPKKLLSNGKKTELLKRLQKRRETISTINKKVEFTKEYDLYETTVKDKSYWENGSMMDLLTDIFGELAPQDGKL